MAYAIRIKGLAKRALKKLRKRNDPKLGAIADKIDSLAGNPRPTGATPYKSLDHAFRIQVGDFRIVYQVDDDSKTVYVVLIGDRKDVYKDRS